MNFKQELIKKIKEYPDVFNEIRAEILVSNNEMTGQANRIDYINRPGQNSILDEVDDLELIDSIIRNLNYYIEYEKEMGEADL